MKTFNIFGDIIGGEAERWFTAEVSPKEIVDFLAEANGEPVEININSYGGSVTGGIAICNALKAYKGEVTCNVLGIAASMASAIACAGKTLKMGEGSFLMIHNPWTYTSGNAEDLRKDAETLDQMRDSILGFYLSKNSKTADEIKGYMDAETWIAAENAAEFGFNVETYTGELKAAASLTRRAFAKAPDAVKAMIKFSDKKPEAEKPVEAAQEAPGAVASEPKAETPAEAEKPVEAKGEAPAEKPAPADNWEARFKGLSTKYNELKAKFDEAESKSASDLVAVTAERDNFKTQVDTMSQDLTAAKAKVSELEAKLAESDKALQTAKDDLAKTSDSLKLAEDKAKALEATRDMITAGVLTPPEASCYADKMKAAKTPAEREKLRALKKAGKIQ